MGGCTLKPVITKSKCNEKRGRVNSKPLKVTEPLLSQGNGLSSVLRVRGGNQQVQIQPFSFHNYIGKETIYSSTLSTSQICFWFFWNQVHTYIAHDTGKILSGKKLFMETNPEGKQEEKNIKKKETNK